MFITAYHYLDIVPKGRDEDNLSFTMEWLRRHDEYDLQEVTMSITIVYDHFFMPGGDINEGKAAATELVEYSKAEMPEVELSLWLAGQENPLHHYHITVFSTGDVIQTMRECAAIKRFVDRLYPYMDLSTFISPVCGWFRCKNVHT